MRYSKFMFLHLSIRCALAQFSVKSHSWKDPVVKFCRLVLSVWSTTACCYLHLISPDGRLKRGCARCSSLWFYGFLCQSHNFLFSFQWTDASALWWCGECCDCKYFVIVECSVVDIEDTVHTNTHTRVIIYILKLLDYILIYIFLLIFWNIIKHAFW